jgi:hypothetical protein
MNKARSELMPETDPPLLATDGWQQEFSMNVGSKVTLLIWIALV